MTIPRVERTASEHRTARSIGGDVAGIARRSATARRPSLQVETRAA